MLNNCLLRKCILLIIVLSFTCVSNADAEKRLILNHSFEKVNTENIPKKWNISSKVFSIDREHSYEGKYSLKLHRTNTDEPRSATQKISLNSNFLYQLSGWMKTKNVKGSGKIAVEFRGKNHKYLGGEYPSGVGSTKSWTHIKSGFFGVPEKATSMQVVCYLHPQDTGTVWFDDITLTSKWKPVMESILAYPNYRGRIKEGSNKPIKIAGVIAKQPKKSYTIKASLLNYWGQVVGNTNKHVNSGENFTLKLSVKDKDMFPPGEYTLNVLIQPTDSNTPIQVKSHSINVLGKDSSSPKVSYIDKYNRLIVHDKPTFPIGLFTHGSITDLVAKKIGDSPFNFIMPYGWAPNIKDLQKGDKYGFYVTATIKDLYFRKDGKHMWPRIKNKADGLWALSKFVHELQNEPALLGWYINDELPLNYIFTIKKHYELVKKLDPSHIVWQVNNKPNLTYKYMNTGDIIGDDPYPVKNSKSAPFYRVSESTRTIKKQTFGARPIWQTLQAFNNLANYWKQEGRTPSPKEVRNMVWQAVDNGANGIILYSFFDMYESDRNPDRPFKTYWPKVKKIAAELNQWAPILLSIEKSPKIEKYKISNKNNSWLSVRTATWHGRTFVFASNNTRKEQTARFGVNSDISHVRSIDVLNNKHEKIEAKSNMWQDTFEPLSVKMYELNGTGEKLPPPQDVHPPKNNG